MNSIRSVCRQSVFIGIIRAMNEINFEAENTEDMIKSAVEKINETMKMMPKLAKPKQRSSNKPKGILNDILTIIATLKTNHFSITKAKSFTKSVNSLAEYLGTTDIQAILFASIFTMYLDNLTSPVSFYSIAPFYECDPITVFQYKSEMEHLKEKKLLQAAGKDTYIVPESVLNPISNNDELPDFEEDYEYDSDDDGEADDDNENDDENEAFSFDSADGTPAPSFKSYRYDADEEEEEKVEISDVIKNVLSQIRDANRIDFSEDSSQIRILTEYLGVPRESAIYFAAIATMFYEFFKRPVSFEDLARHTPLTMMQILKTKDYIKPLLSKELIRIVDPREMSFAVTGFVENAIIKNETIPENGTDSYTSGILSSISKIIVALKKIDFMIVNDDWAVLDSPVSKLCEYLGTEDKMQAMLFATVFTMYFDSLSRPVPYNSISDFYQCNPLIVIQHKGKMKWLVEKGYLMEADPPDDSSASEYYKVPDYVAKAIIENVPIPKSDDRNQKTIHTFIHQIEKIGDRRIDAGNKVQSLYDGILSKEREYKDIKSLEEVKAVLPDITDRAIFYDIAAGMINHINSEIELMILVNRNTDESTGRQSVIDSFMNESHVLFTRELVQFENKASMMDSTVSLTDKAFELLLGDEGKFYHKKVADKELKSPDKIQEKELFYMPENEGEIKKLYESFTKENLLNLQKRLEEKKLPKGICILFYGAPGTGKTETVYQIAKKTGRPIYHVDIGNMRSQWYGETEQKFSKLFNDYRKMCESAAKNDELLPILLFNEADAIFGKRVENAQNGGRVDNTIQNILLEEMERLPGILIATTNIEENLDNAFERRFLFKIKLAKPNAEIKAKIWKSNIEWLSDEEAEKLAKDFSFSGGEIANVVRKITMDEILSGKQTPFEQIVEYCRTEKIQSGNAPVGFKS